MWTCIFIVALFGAANAGIVCRADKCFTNIDDFSQHDVELRSELDDVQKVCYVDLGCFGSQHGELSFLDTLPDSPRAINATFTLFSSELQQGMKIDYRNPLTLMKLKVWRRSPQWLTILVHGFGSGSDATWVSKLKDAIYGDIGGYVLIVDWSKGAEIPHYIRAAANTELVGRMIARLFHRLIMTNPSSFSASKVHFIGHSLGAQMGHFFSTYLQQIARLKPARITALDAAGPEFENHGVFVNKDDADFVEGLHTSAGGSVLTGELGMLAAFGHVDFYPNGGTRQPGCSAFSFGCSHTRAHELYVEARSSKTCKFHSYSCSGGMKQYKEGKCEKQLNNWSEFGLNVSNTPGRGMQFFETNAKAPFCEPILPPNSYYSL